ncbi:amidase family protein, partial [Streptococcus pneumoniae]|nr:amidase family protein [Streptococcus pneumoniae]
LIHLGTDASGSIRIPAAFTGVFGLKPTYGRVPAWPAGALTHVGPLARSTADAAIVLDAITASDPRDWNHVAVLPPGRFHARLEDGVAGLNI